jgi:hypothetical protein
MSSARRAWEGGPKMKHFLIHNVSLELSLINPEEIKHAAFGSSNTTIQIVPQVRVVLSYQILNIQKNFGLVCFYSYFEFFKNLNFK